MAKRSGQWPVKVERFHARKVECAGIRVEKVATLKVLWVVSFFHGLLRQLVVGIPILTCLIASISLTIRVKLTRTASVKWWFSLTILLPSDVRGAHVIGQVLDTLMRFNLDGFQRSVASCMKYKKNSKVVGRPKHKNVFLHSFAFCCSRIEWMSWKIYV